MREMDVEFDYVDLENSFVLSIDMSLVQVCFLLEARLLPGHPRFYDPPHPGEVGAYTRLRWCLSGRVHWNEGPYLEKPARDATGEREFGGIDVWIVSQGNDHLIEGEWGSVLIVNALQTVEYL